MGFDTGTDKLLVEVADGVGTLTFNYPEKHNAMTAEIRGALPATLRALQTDPEVRVVVVTGAGNKAFVSGADISEFATQRTSAQARSSYDQAGSDAGRAWAELEKPVIAMIRGFCMGGGLLTALQADIRIAAENSQFGVPAARLGVGYHLGGVEALVELVGPAWASEILFSARRLSAEEALRIGLVNRVVAGDALVDDVMGLARAIVANAPLTVAACKVAIREARRSPDLRNRERVAAMVEACFASADYREGQAAFLQKRAPRFAGQ
jgi:enoyl-CoA hydratase/carnithine racemase